MHTEEKPPLYCYGAVKLGDGYFSPLISLVSTNDVELNGSCWITASKRFKYIDNAHRYGVSLCNRYNNVYGLLPKGVVYE